MICKMLVPLLCIMLLSHPVSGDWEIETLDSQGVTGYWTAIRLDSLGAVHIVYRDDTDNQLVHIYQGASGWESDVISTCDCWFMSMVLDSTDMPSIAYYEHTLGEIRHVFWQNDHWETSTVSQLPYSGSPYPRTDIELDSEGIAHIVWCDTQDHDLFYAVKNPSGWDITAIEVAGYTGINPSLCLDSDDNPHVLYWNESMKAVMYAVYNGESWNIQILETSPTSFLFSYNTLVLDEEDVPHAAYEISGDYLGAVHYAWWNGTYWEIEHIISLQFAYPGSPQGVALDSSGMPHVIVYSSDMGYAFIYTWRDSTGWDSEIIQYDGVDGALCLDSEGTPHISYCDWTNQDLKYAHRPSTGIGSESQSEPCIPAMSVYQNPCTGYALIQVNLPDPSRVTVKVYDTSGRLIDVHTRTYMERGTHSIQLGEYPPGIYFCRLTSELSEASVSFVVLESR